MRINGFCSLPFQDRIGPEIVATEKGNVRMAYGVSTVLRRLLQEWVDTSPPPRGSGGKRVYLFPNRDHPDGHVSTNRMRRLFYLVADRAGVCGPHVRPHAARHTVAWTLAALGNSVESVAGFVGHRNSQVTQDVVPPRARGPACHARTRVCFFWGGT